MILLLSQLKEWGIRHFVTHKAIFYISHAGTLHKKPQFGEGYVFPITWKFCEIKEGSQTPCIIEKGGWDENNKFFTAHYKVALFNIPPSPPMVTGESMVIPDLSLPKSHNYT